MPETNGVQEHSILENALSLKLNGGIYFDGARVPVNPNTAVLFIGLGGSGADALIRIKNEVKNRMQLPKDEDGNIISDIPNNMGFIAFDTDKATMNLSYGTARFDAHGTEFFDLSVDGIGDVVAAVKKKKAEGDEAWQWLDDGITAIGAGEGANGIRQVGRMFLSLNSSDVVSTIRGKISNLISDQPDIKKVNVFIFSGISGGTGAGTFLDMAYITRQEVRDMVPNVQVMGYLIMPDVNEQHGGDKMALRSNAFACLKELDYWMSAGEHGEHYTQQFDGGYQLYVNPAAKPFDFCHLMNCSDAAGHMFSYDKILRSIAENAFTYVAGEQNKADANGNSTMASMYNNIQGYITIKTAASPYPACYNYLSLGAAKIEIPYTEISTLIAARVFERLNATMFRNRADQQTFDIILHNNLQMTAPAVQTALYKDCPARVILDPKAYNYQDIWPNGTPKLNADAWLAAFQRKMEQEQSTLPARLEGFLRDFIHENLQRKEAGPIFLTHLLMSDTSPCILAYLKEFKKYVTALANQCAASKQVLEEEMNLSFVAGSKVSVFNRGRAVEDYLSKVDVWYRNEENWFLNETIKDVLERLIPRVEAYYNKVLKPLSDILLQLPDIFADNVEYIKIMEDKKYDDDTTILIRPLEFERTRQRDFAKAVFDAEQSFLRSIVTNIKKWIGHDLDNIDERISSTVDVPGVISSFISENFSTLLNVNMEDVITSKIRNKMPLEKYVKDQIDSLLAHSYSMYKKNPGYSITATDDYAILSIPYDCTQIQQIAAAYIKDKHLSDRVNIKLSDEKSRFYIVKVASGFPLYSNAHLCDLETAYEDQMISDKTRCGKHLHAEWLNRLPSPNIQLSWVSGYSCQRTISRNNRYRFAFDRCNTMDLIHKSTRDDHGNVFLLTLANPDLIHQIDEQNLNLPTIAEKKHQLDQIREAMWDRSNTSEDKYIPLQICSKYSLKDPIQNIRENILRFPSVLDKIEEQSTIVDKIHALEEKLILPRYFAYALVNNMIIEEPISRNIKFQKRKGDPLPVLLLKGDQLFDKFEEVQIYDALCNLIANSRQMNVKEEITLQFDNRNERIIHDEEEREEYIKLIKKDLIPKYQKQYDAAEKQVTSAIDSKARNRFVKVRDFYSGIVEELDRILSTVTKGSVIEEEEPIIPEQPVTGPAEKRPRYFFFDMFNWGFVAIHPDAAPMDGQLVFDTQTMQMITYVKPQPRYYVFDQTRGIWVVVENPQIGQYVYDSKISNWISYKPEEPVAPPIMPVAAPGMTGAAPGMTGVAPGMTGAAPGMTGVAPGMTGVAPGMTGAAPGMTGTVPGMSGFDPNKRY